MTAERTASTQPHGMDARWFQGSGGLRLRADVGGDPDAPAVILLHGGGQTRHSWKRGAERLIEAGYFVVSPDARGHGESDWAPDGDYGMPARAADLRAVIVQLPSLPALVGASMGGMTALFAAGGEPQLPIPALILVDVTPRVDEKGAWRIINFMRANPDGFASVEEAADTIARYNPDRPRPRDVSGLRRNLRERDGRWFWHWDPRFLPGDVDPARHQAALEAAASRVAVPTLLIRGGRSDVVGEEEIDHFRRLIAGADYFEAQGAGHMVAGDRNDPFNDAIVAFLTRIHRQPCRGPAPEQYPG